MSRKLKLSKDVSKFSNAQLCWYTAEILMGWRERHSDSMGNRYVQLNKNGTQQTIVLIDEWNPCIKIDQATLLVERVFAKLSEASPAGFPLVLSVSKCTNGEWFVTIGAERCLEQGLGVGKTMALAYTRMAASVPGYEEHYRTKVLKEAAADDEEDD